MKNILSEIKCDDFISIDIETTGLDAKVDRVIEFAAHRFVKGENVDSFSTLIDPKINIPLFITNLTGINNNSVIGKPEFNDVINDIIDFVGDRPIVGHNIQFDLGFLFEKSSRIKSILSNNIVFDTYTLSKIFCYNSKSFSLISLCHYFDIQIFESHRASEDAKNSGILFLKLIDTIMECSLISLKQLLSVMGDMKVPNQNLVQNILNYFIHNNIDSHIIKKNMPKYEFNYNSINNDYYDLEVKDVFEKDGLLDSKLIKYEFRENQFHLSKDIYDTFCNQSNLVAQGGAGIGKTYAYIVAGIINLIENKKMKLIISTHTHSLQNQIFNKDIPEIVSNLDVDCNAVILKGSNNYICLNRLARLINDASVILSDQEILDLQALIIWSNVTLTGDITECNSFRKENSYRLWNLINYQSDFCPFSSCGFDKKCYYTNVKKALINSQIIVVNHSLLINYYNNENALSDSDSMCVIDECHNFHSICREQLSNKISKHQFNILYDKMNSLYKNKKFFNYEDYKKILDQVSNVKKYYSQLASAIIDQKQIYESAYSGYSNTFNLESFEEYQIEVSNFVDNVNVLFLNIKDYHQQYRIDDSISKKIIYKFDSIDKYIMELKNKIDAIFYSKRDSIIWVSFDFINQSIVNFSLNASSLFLNDEMNKIYNQFDSNIFLSATISTNNDYSYFIKQMCLENMSYQDNFSINDYKSPYYYSDQTKLFVYNGDDNINDFEFAEKIALLILDMNKNIPNKRMLVLCTSYSQIQTFKNIISKNNKINVDNFLYQTKGVAKEILLESYLNFSNSVLFGTSTFWEGIDLPEDKLEILLIFKLPFSNPSNPFVQAAVKFYQANNRNAFMEYQLPEAVIKLRQGYGRLIRTELDMGVCILTDPRIMQKRYGSFVIDSFPVEPTLFNGNLHLIDDINKFLGNN